MRNAPIDQRLGHGPFKPERTGSTPAGGATASPRLEDDLLVVAAGEAISVCWRPDTWPRERGVAEASRIPDGYWYVNRVLVEPLGKRGQGLGSRLLQRLLTEAGRIGPKLVVVDPGGYDMNVARQRKFYRRNGFRDDPEIKGRLFMDVT